MTSRFIRKPPGRPPTHPPRCVCGSLTSFVFFSLLHQTSDLLSRRQSGREPLTTPPPYPSPSPVSGPVREGCGEKDLTVGGRWVGGGGRSYLLVLNLASKLDDSALDARYDR